MRTTFTWMATALGVLFLAVMLVPACSDSDDNPIPTGSSAISPSSSPGLVSTSAVPQRDSDSESDDSESDDSEGEDSESDDSASEDDDSSDDLSGDGGLADSALGGDDLDDNGSRVHDVLLSADACPGPFTVGGTVVNTTAETRSDCEPGCDGHFERLTPDQFCPFLVAGLPIRARGTNDAGTLNASRVRIDDETKVTGTISVGSAALAPGTPFTLSVLGLGDLQFVVAPGALIETFAAGSTVRVEGVVPPLTAGGGLPTFGATEIQN